MATSGAGVEQGWLIRFDQHRDPPALPERLKIEQVTTRLGHAVTRMLL